MDSGQSDPDSEGEGSSRAAWAAGTDQVVVLEGT